MKTPRRALGLTGGGSAGHALPALAVGREFMSLGHPDVVYFGRANSVEAQLAERAGLEFVAVPAAALRRYRSAKNLLMPFVVIRGAVRAVRELRRSPVGVLFSKGSFVAVPVTWGAWLLGIPVVLHESDHTLGLANKIIALFAREVMVSFEGTPVPWFARRKVLLVGPIIRQDLADGDPAAFRARHGIPSSRPVVLVFGGSSGAQRMNSAIRSGLDLLLTASSVVHIVGPGNLDESLRGCAGYHQFEFLHAEMVDALWAADVVAARAGANTIAELSALQRPAVLVPLPTTVSRGDQFENAQKFVSENRGTVVQDELMPTQLVPAILTTLASGPAPQIPDVDDVRSVARRIATDLASYLS